ncbi:hypothetical protein PInf_006025 [Phytophthora infestans]|nr:hypothetical protein PInf_006025 [Phytophthora infestans]
MPSASPSTIVLRVRRPPDNNQQTQDLETEPLSPVAANGIVLGTGLQALFKLRGDSKIDAAHGTLERTSGLGIWVYSDHSREGSILNNELKIHNDAVVVRHGDTLKLGQTKIELCLKTGKLEVPEDHDEKEQGEMPPEEENTAKPARPPPLEYSSSPIVSPSSLRQRHNLFQQPPSSLPVPTSGLITGVPPPPVSVGAKPTARRDDLRIQVSKKMAAAAPTSAGKAQAPQIPANKLEFQTPSSPVAQRDIRKQQESLQTILQHKSEEEQLLKQQQEEWMRTHLMSGDTNEASPTSTSALSPSKSEINFLEHDDLTCFPAPAPVLLRTLSLGISEQRSIRPSPRLTAAIRASRARLNSFEEKVSTRDSKGRRKTTALVFSPSIRLHHEGATISPVKESELRTSSESIASTASTVITCHRRVTSSLSSATSVDLCDFLGYQQEEDAEDMVTSYTSPDLYGSDELLRRSREDTTLLYDANRNSMYGTLSPPQSRVSSTLSPSNTRLGSPRQRPETSITSSNQQLNDSPRPSLDKAVSLGSRVLSPRGGDFDPRSPYKSTAALTNQMPQLQKLRRPTFQPEDAGVEGTGASEPRQPKPKPFRKRASFRRHSLTPLSGLNKR